MAKNVEKRTGFVVFCLQKDCFHVFMKMPKNN